MQVNGVQKIKKTQTGCWKLDVIVTEFFLNSTSEIMKKADENIAKIQV